MKNLINVDLKYTFEVCKEDIYMGDLTRIFDKPGIGVIVQGNFSLLIYLKVYIYIRVYSLHREKKSAVQQSPAGVKMTII